MNTVKDTQLTFATLHPCYISLFDKLSLELSQSRRSWSKCFVDASTHVAHRNWANHRSSFNNKTLYAQTFPTNDFQPLQLTLSQDYHTQPYPKITPYDSRFDPTLVQALRITPHFWTKSASMGSCVSSRLRVRWVR